MEDDNNNNNTATTTVTTVVAMDQFKRAVDTWLAIDNQIKDVAAEMKEVRVRHKELKQSILDFMCDQDIGKCNVLGGDEQLKVNQKERKIRPKKTDILRKMIEFFQGDEDKAKSLYDYIYEQTETEPAVSLTRSVTAQGRKKRKAANNEDDESVSVLDL